LWRCISAADARAIIFGVDLSGAVKNIHDQIPENVQLYYFGTDPCSDIKASSLIKELERSSLKPPAVDHTKSIYDVLLYVYTSGTTGNPKPAIVTNEK